MARIGLKITDEQKEWLEKQSEQTGESVATIIRQILNEKIKGKQ